MARPAFLLCDADALFQLLLACEVRPLRILQSKYSIQPLIVPEVEIELRSNRKLSKRIAHELRKALGHNIFRVLDHSVLTAHYGPPSGAAAATSALNQIAGLGRTYQRYVDFGEAYTHAAAITLGVPVLSNDRSALIAIESAGLHMPPTVLRTFDLIALSSQVAEMSAFDCETFLAFLKSENEYVPNCLKHKSFTAGINDLPIRILDAAYQPIGSTRNESFKFATKLVL